MDGTTIRSPAGLSPPSPANFLERISDEDVLRCEEAHPLGTLHLGRAQCCRPLSMLSPCQRGILYLVLLCSTVLGPVGYLIYTQHLAEAGFTHYLTQCVYKAYQPLDNYSRSNFQSSKTRFHNVTHLLVSGGGPELSFKQLYLLSGAGSSGSSSSATDSS